MDSDGDHQINITDNPAEDRLSAWSPDGKKIAFVSDRDGNGEIYVVNAKGKNIEKLTDNFADDLLPIWCCSFTSM